MNNIGIYIIISLLGIVHVLFSPLVMTSQVCTETVTNVTECPSNVNEYEKRATEKCTKACGNSKGDIKYKYHCMLDSTHKYLIEMCAIPEYLFDYCPAYDVKGPQIQKDESRPCNTSSSRTYYNSDELFFCDLTNCLDSFTSTTCDSPSETTDITTQIPDGESWLHHLIWILALAVISLIMSRILFIWKKQSSESSICFQNWTPDCCKTPTKEIKENEQTKYPENRENLLSGTGDNDAITV